MDEITTIEDIEMNPSGEDNINFDSTFKDRVRVI